MKKKVLSLFLAEGIETSRSYRRDDLVRKIAVNLN